MPESPNLETTWQSISTRLRRAVGDAMFEVWLAPLTLADHRDGALVVCAPHHVRSSVANRYAALIAESAEDVLDAAVAVEIVAPDWRADEEPPPGIGARPVSELNPKYTFDQFVIGDANRLAHAAALAVAEQPAQAYNPVFIHGPPGLGKTHLLQAIGNYIEEHGAGLRVRYATVETFTGEFVDAVRTKTPIPFRDRFRDVDVLLVDDVQFLAGKGATREEFFHTFNALYERGAQIVLSSDARPTELVELEDRLTERFGSGLVARVDPPDLPVRMAVLRTRGRLDGLGRIDDETLAEIARLSRSSVRALEGALIRVIAYASIHDRPLSPDLVREVLPPVDPDGADDLPPPTTATVMEAVAGRLGVPRETLAGRSRGREATRARHVAIYLARELTGDTLATIGRAFGGRDHATVLSAHRKVAREVEAPGAARDLVGELRAVLGG